MLHYTSSTSADASRSSWAGARSKDPPVCAAGVPHVLRPHVVICKGCSNCTCGLAATNGSLRDKQGLSALDSHQYPTYAFWRAHPPALSAKALLVLDPGFAGHGTPSTPFMSVSFLALLDSQICPDSIRLMATLKRADAAQRWSVISNVKHVTIRSDTAQTALNSLPGPGRGRSKDLHAV